MDRLLTMDADALADRMQAEFRRTMEQVADAVNAAPTGNLISGSEMQVRDLLDEFRLKAFEMSVQQRIDSTESSFSPSAGHDGQTQSQQGAVRPDHANRQRKG